MAQLFIAQKHLDPARSPDVLSVFFNYLACSCPQHSTYQNVGVKDQRPTGHSVSYLGLPDGFPCTSPSIRLRWRPRTRSFYPAPWQRHAWLPVRPSGFASGPEYRTRASHRGASWSRISRYRRPNPSSTASGRGASKSAGTTKSPLPLPITRRRGAEETGVSLTSGRPERMMITSSPASAWSRSRDRCVFAS